MNFSNGKNNQDNSLGVHLPGDPIRLTAKATIHIILTQGQLTAYVPEFTDFSSHPGAPAATYLLSSKAGRSRNAIDSQLCLLRMSACVYLPFL